MMNAGQVSKLANISMPSSYKLIADLEKMDILREMTGGQCGRVYIFENYLKLFR